MHPRYVAFLEHLDAVRKSPLTIRRYADVLRDLDAHTGGEDPGSLATAGLQRFATAPRKDGFPRAPAGVNLRVAVLRATFAFLHDSGSIPSNPAARLVAIPEPRRAPKYLTTAEVQRLLRHVVRDGTRLAPRNVALVVALWQTGLRVRELARLDIGQLDRERRAFADVLVKGGHARDVAVNDELLAILDQYLASRGVLAPDAPIFARRDGKRLSVRAIQALFEHWRTGLGWTRPLHPHVLRHTHATGALAEGVGIETVAELLGHAGLRSVMVYAAVQDTARRAALAKLGRLVPRELVPERFPGVAPWLTGNVRPANDSPCAEAPFNAAA